MKVGVVGRTGAGKSSLLQVLLRMAECSSPGCVWLDFVDVSGVGLGRLRKGLSLISQSPFLFEGTVHENVDPWGRFSCEAVLEALGDV